MKTARYILFLSLFIVLMACEKVTDNTKVYEYISQLKAGTYDSYELPEFTPSDIPALLQYRNETAVITKFPRNGISSFYQAECKLGMYVLWTIESVRAVEIDSKFLIGRFPSQNPILALKNSAELSIVFDDNSMNVAADAYYHWWHAIYIFNDRMSVDPLKNTDFRWH